MVRGLVHDLRKRRHRKTLVQTFMLAFLLAGGLFAAGWLRDEFGPAQLKQLGCAEVIQLREAYTAGTLNKTLVRSVSYHLGHCRHCRDHYAPEDVRQPSKPPCPFASAHPVAWITTTAEAFGMRVP